MQWTSQQLGREALLLTQMPLTPTNQILAPGMENTRRTAGHSQDQAPSSGPRNGDRETKPLLPHTPAQGRLRTALGDPLLNASLTLGSASTNPPQPSHSNVPGHPYHLSASGTGSGTDRALAFARTGFTFKPARHHRHLQKHFKLRQDPPATASAADSGSLSPRRREPPSTAKAASQRDSLLQPSALREQAAS